MLFRELAITSAVSAEASLSFPTRMASSMFVLIDSGGPFPK
jgi:hypothetical protein